MYRRCLYGAACAHVAVKHLGMRVVALCFMGGHGGRTQYLVVFNECFNTIKIKSMAATGASYKHYIAFQ